MTIQDTVNSFLENKKEGSRASYSSKINAFIEFLQKEKGVNDRNFIEYLSALKTEVILEALSGFISTNKITKESVARFYANTVRGYFEHLNELGIENTNLLKTFGNRNAKSYYKKINEFIEGSPELNKVEAKEAMDFEDIKILISEADERIDSIIEDKTVLLNYQRKNNPYNDLVYLLCLKLMLFTGAAYVDLRELPNSCFDDVRYKITINTYTLHLPDNLAMQLKAFIKIKSQRKVENGNFFVHSDGGDIPRQTSGLSELINEIVGRYDTSGIRKYVITEMIRKGINQSFIMKLTNVGETIFEDCQNTVNVERHIEANRYIDSKLRDMVVFDFL